jgi:hypothetical protein
MDQRGGLKARRLGSKPFSDLLLANYEKPFDLQKESLINALNRHRGMEPYTDDITLIGFRIDPQSHCEYNMGEY